MKLYEISQDYINFMTQLENGDIPEIAVNDTLQAIQGDFNSKADNIACLIKSLTADAIAIKKERDKLYEREKTKKAQAERLSKYLLQEMQAINKNKLETPRNVISLRKSKSIKVDENFIDWAKGNNADLLTFKEPSANKSAIKDLIKSGQEVPYCKLIENQNLTIK